MRRVAVIGIVLVLAVAAGAGGYAWWRSRTETNGERPLVLYGNVEIRDALLAFDGEAHVAEVLVEEGDRVEGGAVLARLDTGRLRAEIARAQAEIETQAAIVRRLENGTRRQEIEQARAEVSAAEARVRNARRNVERLGETASTGASSAQDLDDARAQLDVEESFLEVRRKALDLAQEGPRKERIAEARARLTARRAALSLLEDRLADTTLTAPAAGVIQSRILEPGEFATPTRPAFSLALLDPKWVRAFVPQPDLGRIQEGMSAVVSSDSFSDRSFPGWVGFIAPTAEFTPKTVQTTDLRTKLVYEVRIYVKDPANQLRLGQPVTVEVDSADRQPTSAPGRTTSSEAAERQPSVRKGGAS